MEKKKNEKDIEDFKKERKLKEKLRFVMKEEEVNKENNIGKDVKEMKVKKNKEEFVDVDELLKKEVDVNEENNYKKSVKNILKEEIKKG